MVPDGGFAAHLELLDVADLLDGAMVLFNMPVPVMLFGEGFPIDGNTGKWRLDLKNLCALFLMNTLGSGTMPQSLKRRL